MRRPVALTVLAVLTAPAGLFAEEPHLRFVAGLREQGYADLAQEYLERLAKNPPPALAAALPLELARTRLDAATQEVDDKKRATQFAAARSALETFLNSKPAPRLAVEANYDLARLIVLQGKQTLGQARRQDSPAAKQDGLARAGQLFAEAAGRMTAAARQLDDQLTALGEPSTDEQKQVADALRRAARDAELEAAVLGLQRALTYPDTDTKMLKKRADEIAKARKELDKLSGKYADDRAGWLARVWAGQCLVELDNKGEAKRLFEAVVKERSKPHVAEAARVAEFRLLELTDQNPQIKTRVQDVQRGCDDWLRLHAKFRDTPEGRGVRYLQATNIEEQARPLIRPGKDNVPVFTGTSRAMVKQAETILKELAESDHDYTNRARRRRAGLLALLSSEKLAQGVSALANFEECYLAAQVDAYELSQPKGDGPADDRPKRLKRVIESLTRAQHLATKDDPPRDVFDSQLMLAYAYLADNDPYRAAVLAEHLARGESGSRGAEATAYALQAHARILADDRNRGAPPDEIEADRKRLRELARFMEATWPDEPATDAARHQLAMLLLEDSQYADAAELLSRIQPGYPALAYARFQQGVAAQQALRDGRLPAERKQELVRKAIADFEQVTEPPTGASAETVLGYAQARMQQATLVLLDSPKSQQYDQVEQLGKRLGDQLPKLIDANDEKLPQLKAEAARLRTAGVQGRAFLLLREDKADDAKKILTPLAQAAAKELTDAAKSPHRDDAWFQNYLRTLRESMLLELRANIQQGDSDAARKSLAALNKAVAAAGQEPANTLLVRLVQEMKADLDRARNDNLNDRVERLEKGLTGFLDGLAKADDLSADGRFFLARAFTSLDQPAKAAGLLAGIPEAKADDEAGTRLYRSARLALAKAYRAANQFKQADEVLRPVLGTADKKGWGFNDLEVNREVVQLLEARENINGAVRHCRDMQSRLQGQMQDNERLKEWYFEYYFLEMKLLTNAAPKQKDPAAGERLLKSVASRLAKLEQRQPDYGGPGLKEKYQELLQTSPALKAAYKAEGGVLD